MLPHLFVSIWAFRSLISSTFCWLSLYCHFTFAQRNYNITFYLYRHPVLPWLWKMQWREEEVSLWMHLNLVIMKKGENDLPGLTDTEIPRMRGPKRAPKIRKLFNRSKEDDVRKHVNTYRRTFTTKAGTVACLILNIHTYICIY